jgi:hypothetical protein
MQMQAVLVLVQVRVCHPHIPSLPYIHLLLITMTVTLL